MCKALGINIKKTEAESSWSNDLVERHNLVLASMLDKVLEDTSCHPELAFQLIYTKVFTISVGNRKENKLPLILNAKASTLTRQPVSKLVSSNLDAIHKARKAFT